MKPYYADTSVTIYHGDALEVLPMLAERSVDLLLTDPPYNFGFDYGMHNDNQSPEDYAGWCRGWFTESSRVTRRQLLFPGHGNLPVWWDIRKPSAVGCWYKPGTPASCHLGWSEWEPYLYWGKRISGGSDVIRVPGGNFGKKQTGVGDHPCPKPVELMLGLIAKMKPDSVIDPFLGSGTSLVAAKNLQVPAIGIEIEERYCEIAARRCSQEVLGLVGV